MSRIFISYRRIDSISEAGRIYDHLVSHFGDCVFKDVDSIVAGDNFRRRIKEEVVQCQVLLVVIGKNWLKAQHPSGKRRLDDSADWVRLEIETALERGIPTIPLILGGARMPTSSELPQSLQPLAKFQTATIRNDPDFRRDMTQLFTVIQKHFDTLEPSTTQVSPVTLPPTTLVSPPSHPRWPMPSSKKATDLGTSNPTSPEITEHEKLELKIKNCREQIKTLNQILENIRKLAAQGDSQTDYQIVQIIDDSMFSYAPYREISDNSPLIIKWVDVRIDEWVSSIKRKTEYRIPKSISIKDFRDSIRTYLKLLCSNIRHGTYEAPNSENTQSDHKYPFAYRIALEDIKKQINSELHESNNSELNILQQDILINYLDRLIKDIR